MSCSLKSGAKLPALNFNKKPAEMDRRDFMRSGAALATVVGVLVEVPVMLSVVSIVNRSKQWYEQGAGLQEARDD